MPAPQALLRPPEFSLLSERLGPLPLINHFLQRSGLEELLDRYVPTLDRRCAVPHAKALGVLLRSIIVEREPVYRQEETVHGFAPGLFGLGAVKGSISMTIASAGRWTGCSMPTGPPC